MTYILLFSVIVISVMCNVSLVRRNRTLRLRNDKLHANYNTLWAEAKSVEPAQLRVILALARLLAEVTPIRARRRRAS